MTTGNSEFNDSATNVANLFVVPASNGASSAHIHDSISQPIQKVDLRGFFVNAILAYC